MTQRYNVKVFAVNVSFFSLRLIRAAVTSLSLKVKWCEAAASQGEKTEKPRLVVWCKSTCERRSPRKRQIRSFSLRSAKFLILMV